MTSFGISCTQITIIMFISPCIFQGVDVERVANKTMQADAANAAARAAVGGKDLASKWKLMAEKKNQKHGISEHPTKKLIHSECLQAEIAITWNQ